MWIVFEGLDKTGKTTLEWELLKATNFKHVVIDRGPVGYMTFDKLLNRETKLGNQEFIHQARKIMKPHSEFIVVYCNANENIVNERLANHNETQLDCGCPYSKMQKMYKDNIHRFYKPEKTLELDTSDKSIEECVQLIISKITEVQKHELQKCKSRARI